MYGSWIYNYLCKQCISPLTLYVRTPLKGGVLDTTLCHKVCQWFATEIYKTQLYAGFITTYANSVYHHWRCEFEPHSRFFLSLDYSKRAPVLQLEHFLHITKRWKPSDLLINNMIQTKFYQTKLQNIKATLQNYKATWTSLLTNEKAKSTSRRRLLRSNRPKA